MTGDHVALLLPEPGDFAEAMFGAWTGGFGVLGLPVDFPDARLRSMLDSAAPCLLVTDATSHARAVSITRDIPVHLIEDLRAAEADTSPRPADTDAPAYTIFTSGSTGRPKGVTIRHGQMSRLLSWELREWPLGPGTRMAQTLSLGFDFGLQEVFSALGAGGCLVVPAPADRRDARSYARFLRRERVDTLFITPSFADQLAAAGEHLPDLRFVLIGGEVLRGSTTAALRSLTSTGCRIVNGYGPTEATVNCLAYDVPDDEVGPDILPVGRASAASTIHLVDPSNRSVPVGAIGEILIGGPGVADGYLGDPETSARQFVPDPVTGVAGETVYRTGDLAYVDRDRGFVVIGRGDRQVKIRGIRVELAEIEATLRLAHGVTAVAVLVVDSPRRVAAGVTGSGLDVPTLRRAASAVLPAAMVPEQFVLLEDMPLTTNGKLDEGVLADLADRQYLAATTPTSTVSDVEAAVCRVWAAALPDVEVKPDANVFDLGAHSLIVTQVHALLQAAVGAAFPIHYMFEYPRPRELARQLARQGHRAGGDAESPTANAEDYPWR